jgi:hypothetical protein
MDRGERIMLSEVQCVRGANPPPPAATTFHGGDALRPISVMPKRAEMHSSGLGSASASSSTATIAGAAGSARPNVAGKGEAPAGRMYECGRAKLGARRVYFVFIIRALPPTGALSHAIYVSDFQDLCYRCSSFPKRPQGRPEARRAWIAGRLLRSRRGSILVARRCGGASSHIRARRRSPVEGQVGEKSGSQSGNLDSPASS